MTSNQDLVVKNAYEQENMTPEQIAHDQGWDIVAVKSKLISVSSKFRKNCGMEEPDKSELNFSHEEQVELKRVIYNLAISSEDEHLRFKAATYCRDDAMGRKEVVKNIQQSGNFQLNVFNQMLSSVREKASQLSERVNQKKVIEA